MFNKLFSLENHFLEAAQPGTHASALITVISPNIHGYSVHYIIIFFFFFLISAKMLPVCQEVSGNFPIVVTISKLICRILPKGLEFTTVCLVMPHTYCTVTPLLGSPLCCSHTQMVKNFHSHIKNE